MGCVPQTWCLLGIMWHIHADFCKRCNYCLAALNSHIYLGRLSLLCVIFHSSSPELFAPWQSCLHARYFYGFPLDFPVSRTNKRWREGVSEFLPGVSGSSVRPSSRRWFWQRVHPTIVWDKSTAEVDFREGKLLMWCSGRKTGRKLRQRHSFTSRNELFSPQN